MTEEISAAEVHKAVHEGFRDVVKGNGIGVREAIALDDYESVEGLARARAEDVEEHWWDISPEWQEMLGESLTFTDREGFRFLLPAAMIAVLENKIKRADAVAHSIFFHLCIIPKHLVGRVPHHGHKEYTEHLRQVSPKKIAEYCEFSPAQTHAVALYFLWEMQKIRNTFLRKTPKLCAKRCAKSARKSANRCP